MRLVIKQTGNNPDFPIDAEAWEIDELTAPDWLVDRAKVSGIQNSSYILEYRTTNTGVLELLDSSGLDVLVRIKPGDKYILHSKTHPLLTLTEIQLRYLYKIKKTIS